MVGQSLLSALLLIGIQLANLASLSESSKTATSKPNIIFLLTDDQDVTAGSLDYMPRLGNLLRQEGTEFVNYFVSTGLCCPSRATIIKGQFCHNTGIWDNGDLNNNTFLSGGFTKFQALGLENETIGTLMQAAGYETKFCGKYLNGYSDAHASSVPPGWDHWQGMTDTAYFGPHFSVNGKLLKLNKTIYQTDYIRDVAIKFIQRNQTGERKPFFMYLAPFAPHAPALPAPRHQNLFNDLKAPRTASFNPADDLQKQKPSWLRRLPLLTSKQINNTDQFFRQRIRSLQAVDEMLGFITKTLAEEGLLNNTYIFYMGDNGQHLGDYRLGGGKRQAYDTDIRVPFLVRGPGVEGGRKITEVTQSVDLLPTWAELADQPLKDSNAVDGRSLVPLLHGTYRHNSATNTFRSVALAEMYGGSSNMGASYDKLPGFWHNRFWNNTYQAVRVINGTGFAANANWLYVEWCTGETEFYNATTDPRMVHNLAESISSDLRSQLSALVHQLGNCKGDECRSVSQLDGLKSLQELKDKDLPCHNPPNMNEELFGVYRKTFPFDDSDVVPDDFEMANYL